MSKKGKPRAEVQQKIRSQRIFSEAFKRQKVKDIENGLIKVRELARLYEMTPQTVYKWLHKYSVHYKKGSVQVVQMESEQYKTLKLLSQIKELEAALGRKQLSIDYLEELLSVASQELKIDLKKNFDTKCSSTTTKDINREDTK